MPPLVCGGAGGCGKPPVWFGGERGRYQCDHGPAGWRTTSGPIPEPEAAAEWDKWFGVKR